MTDQIVQTESGLRPFYLKTLFFWFLTSGIVLIEPAPFDVLFPVVAFMFVANHRLFLPRQGGLLFPCLLLFLAANVLSVLAADDVTRAASFLGITVYVFLLASFLAIIIANFGYPVIEKIMNGYVGIAVFSAGLGVVSLAKLLPASITKVVTVYEGTRVSAFFKDPNVYAPFLMVALIYSIDKFVTKKASRLLWGGSVFVLLLGILVGFSRAAWGVSIGAIVLYFVFAALGEKQLSKLWKYVMYFSVLTILGGGLIAVFVKEADMTKFLAQRLSLQTYDQDRFAVQRMAIKAGTDNLIGIGPGQSEKVFEAQSARRTGATHSLYLRLIAETGVLGALSFFGILYLTAKKAIWLCLHGAKENRSLHSVFAASFFAILMNSFVIDSLHWRHFFVVIGLLWGLDMLNKWKPAQD